MTLDEQQAICGAVQHEVYCANHCDWRGLEADLVEDEEGNEPHCPKCGSNWAILDVDLEAFAYTARTEWPKLIEEHRKALAEIDERQASFDLRWKADMRAIKAWQAAHPGKERTWPDHADLCVWLLDEIERLKAAGKVLAVSLRENWGGEISRKEDEACRVFKEGE